jgi:hypothetical protein
MRRTNFDGKDGAGRACPLLTAFAATCNSRDCQIVSVINRPTTAGAKNHGAAIDIKICLYVYCAPAAPLIRDGGHKFEDFRRS